MSRYLSPRSGEMATIVSPVPELGSKLSDSGEDCSGASPDKEVVIANERKTSVNRSVFAYCYDLVRIGEVCKLWSHARADARDASCAGRASKCD